MFYFSFYFRIWSYSADFTTSWPAIRSTSTTYTCSTRQTGSGESWTFPERHRHRDRRHGSYLLIFLTSIQWPFGDKTSENILVIESLN